MISDILAEAPAAHQVSRQQVSHLPPLFPYPPLLFAPPPTQSLLPPPGLLAGVEGLQVPTSGVESLQVPIGVSAAEGDEAEEEEGGLKEEEGMCSACE